MHGTNDAVEQRLELEGGGLALVRWGAEEASPVLCLHGWLDNANSFAPIAPYLPEVCLLALDLPGHGRSDHRPAGVGYHYLDWVVDVVEAADRLGLSRFSLMGHSMGAGIAALVAGTVPERVDRLVMLEGAGPRSTSAGQVPTLLADYVAGRTAARAVRRPGRGSAFATAVRARLAYADPLSDHSAELLCRRAVVQAPQGGVVFGNDRRLQRAMPRMLSSEAIVAFFARIACPALLVVASEGLGRRAGISEDRLAAIADLTHVEVPGGHHVHMDCPEVVAEHLRRFLIGA
ncbi:MAG: alpha/beta hydrolase [Myxococcales bacterium]|nr:alpha/beta hydrolase [Myxococcales bacterium]MDD9971309.1 alpha/beta hydrolase [Myxococcales bacterium]